MWEFCYEIKSPWLCADDVEVTEMIVLTFQGAAACQAPSPSPSPILHGRVVKDANI